jgi:hypothetical protein
MLPSLEPCSKYGKSQHEGDSNDIEETIRYCGLEDVLSLNVSLASI